jgi:plasmid stabilization system protein ParE
MPERETEYRIIISKRAAQQLVSLSAFVAQLEERLARKLVADFRDAALSLRQFPYRNPVLRSDEFFSEKYRKLVFGKWYLLIYQIKGETVYVEHVVDGRQDYQWLLDT